MSDVQEISIQESDEKTIAFRQALKYADDLAKIYEAEKAKRKALEAANAQIRAIIDSINDGMLATDSGFMIIEVNEVFLPIYGTGSEKTDRQGGFSIFSLFR
ncbi:MAG: PAS domain-containing protein [Desulfobacteraceae bacterium]|nr:PAS domain-containing protein [Desulfobacteraceae bacterium]